MKLLIIALFTLILVTQTIIAFVAGFYARIEEWHTTFFYGLIAFGECVLFGFCIGLVALLDRRDEKLIAQIRRTNQTSAPQAINGGSTQKQNFARPTASGPGRVSVN